MSTGEMRISIAADHVGFALKRELVSCFCVEGVTFTDRGGFSSDNSDYPDYVPLVVKDVLFYEHDFGVLICSTGIGMSVMANRYAGIRAALCADKRRAMLAREHNNANLLCLGASFTSVGEASAMLEAFVNTAFDGRERHYRRLSKFDTLGEKL